MDRYFPNRDSGVSVRSKMPRPVIPRRKHPDLTGFLIGCVGLVGFLFLATVAFAHVAERTALTIAQGETQCGM